jgi:hypothetical protein
VNNNIKRQQRRKRKYLSKIGRVSNNENL